MSKRRVVITGIGVVAPNGIGKDAFWNALVNGQNAIGPITRFDASSFSTRFGGEVKNFTPHPRIPAEHLPQMDRAYQLGVTAALQAVEDAGMELECLDRTRGGVYMGLGIAGLDGYERDFRLLKEAGLPAVHKNWYHSWFPSACSGYISLILGFQGSSQVVSTGCSSSLDATGMAFQSIRDGWEDFALAGGTEAPLTPVCLNSFCSMRALSTRNDDPTHASRPFDKDRDGFILSEGGAVVVLESLEHAKARGAPIYAELKGYGTTSNAYHMTAPDPSAIQTARAFRLALEDAEVPNESIGLFMAHGSSTPLNETVETLAVKKAFGNHAQRMLLMSIKSMIGHTLGSAGILQIISAALSLVHQMAPPTINYEAQDPSCDLDCVPNHAREVSLSAVLVNSAGFSGKNSAAVLAAYN
ncbi:MAG: beta-ketoacyl-ACP synthase II [Elusimicrobiota bacterium]|jgi:3-oxoacyl-[acyl-carrier-protein] synthase II